MSRMPVIPSSFLLDTGEDRAELRPYGGCSREGARLCFLPNHGRGHYQGHDSRVRTILYLFPSLGCIRPASLKLTPVFAIMFREVIVHRLDVVQVEYPATVMTGGKIETSNESPGSIAHAGRLTPSPPINEFLTFLLIAHRILPLAPCAGLGSIENRAALGLQCTTVHANGGLDAGARLDKSEPLGYVSDCSIGDIVVYWYWPQYTTSCVAESATARPRDFAGRSETLKTSAPLGSGEKARRLGKALLCSR